MSLAQEPIEDPGRGEREAVTHTLRAESSADGRDEANVAEIVYGDIRRLAAGLLRGERAGHTLQPTALVHEAWMRLVDETGMDAAQTTLARRRFQSHAVQAMRRVLIDHARARCQEKRGGGQQRVPLSESIAFGIDDAHELLDLDAALSELAQRKPRAAKIAELRIYGGLSTAEAAAAVETSLATAKAEWALAKARLTSRVRSERGPDAIE